MVGELNGRWDEMVTSDNLYLDRENLSKIWVSQIIFL